MCRGTVSEYPSVYGSPPAKSDCLCSTSRSSRSATTNTPLVAGVFTAAETAVIASGTRIADALVTVNATSAPPSTL